MGAESHSRLLPLFDLEFFVEFYHDFQKKRLVIFSVCEFSPVAGARLELSNSILLSNLPIWNNVSNCNLHKFTIDSETPQPTYEKVRFLWILKAAILATLTHQSVSQWVDHSFKLA